MTQPAVASIPPLSTELAPRSRRATNLWISLGLIVVTAAVYAPVRHYGFICMDDPTLISDNPHVRAGLTRDTFVWAWTQPGAGTWQHTLGFYAPLTALSYLLDSQLFGMDPGPMHLSNVVIHVLNTLLLFAIFARATAKPWRSAWVAGLFALHPLHIESVAWLAERKDVLSTFFWMLTTWTYLWYARRPGVRRYAVLLLSYLAALLSKPMVVTQPFALLLLDIWPLGRLVLPGGVAPLEPDGAAVPVQRTTLARLIAEKLPLMLPAGIFAEVALIARDNAAPNLLSPLAGRIANALVAYVTYLVRMFWPVGLAVPYTYEPLSLELVIASAVLLLGITGLVVWGMRRHPYLLVGWLWYIGLMLPASGLIHNPSLAPTGDRYTYVPSIGIFLILAWGIPDLLARWRYQRIAGAAAGAAALAACTVLTVRHLPVWYDAITLFGHTVAVSPDSLMAHFVVGNELLKQGKPEAWNHFVEAVRIGQERLRLPPYWELRGPIDPYYASALANIGLMLVRRGDLDTAKQYYLESLSRDPRNGRAHTRLGMILTAQGDTNGAVEQYQEAVRVEPDLAAAHTNLAIAFERLGQTEQALAAYAEGVRLEPQNAESRGNLGAALATAGRFPEAIDQLRTAVQLNPDLAVARFDLAGAYVKAGRVRDAITELDVVVRQRPDSTAAAATLAWLLATADDANLRDGARALQLAEAAAQQTEYRDVEVLNSLAAADAEVGQFADAIRVAEQAQAQAERQGQIALASALAQRLLDYRAGRPARDQTPRPQRP